MISISSAHSRFSLELAQLTWLGGPPVSSWVLGTYFRARLAREVGFLAKVPLDLVQRMRILAGVISTSSRTCLLELAPARFGESLAISGCLRSTSSD